MHESTQTAPFYFMFGRQPKIPQDPMIRLPSLQDDQPLDAKYFAAEREQELKASFELCAKNIEKQQERSKRNFNKKIRKTTLVFKPTDKVIIRKFVTKNKIDDRYQAEIFEVIRPKALGLPLYLVKGLESGTIKEIHPDKLVLFHQANPSQYQVTIDKIAKMHNKKFETDDDEEYSVKKQLNN